VALLVLMSYEADVSVSVAYQLKQVTQVTCTSHKRVMFKNALLCIATLWPKH